MHVIDGDHRSAGMPESVKDGMSGLCVDPDDHEALVATLKKLLGDPELRRRLGEGGYDRVLQHFRYEAFARELKKFMESHGPT